MFRSLRSIMWIGVTLSVLFSAGAFAVVVQRVVRITDARLAMNHRYDAALAAHDQRVTAIQAERDGDDLAAIEAARTIETTSEIAMSSVLTGEERKEIAAVSAQFDEAIASWRLGNRAGPFPAVLAAGTAVRARLQNGRNVRYEHFADALRSVIGAGIVLAVLDLVFSITMVVWVLRRTALPLERLASSVVSGRGFPLVTQAVGIQEVDTLARALHDLDIAVRDKEQRLAEAHAEAVELTRFGEHVQQVVDEQELHELLARRVRAVTGAAAVNTLISRHGQDRLDLAYTSTAGLGRRHLPVLTEPMRCRAVRTLKPVIGDGDSPTACRCPLVPAGGSYLCEPLLASGELVGVVNLQADVAGRFTQRVERRVRASLGFGATALASLRLLAATRERALRDPLTGAYNRAFLAEYLTKQVAQAERTGMGLGVLAVDLDHFKRLNDTFGHATGDRALIATVDALHRAVRNTDAVVRLGGEELLVVLVDSTLTGATEVAERVRAAIARIDLMTDRGRAEVRASIGVAAYPEHGRDEAELMAAADRALYRAKDAGRDRVMVAEGRTLSDSFDDAPVAVAN